MGGRDLWTAESVHILKGDAGCESVRILKKGSRDSWTGDLVRILKRESRIHWRPNRSKFLNYYSVNTTILCFLWFNRLNLWYFYFFSIFYFSISCFMSHDQNRMHFKGVGWKLRFYWPVCSWRFNGSLNSRLFLDSVPCLHHPLSIVFSKFARGSFWQILNCRKRKRRKIAKDKTIKASTTGRDEYKILKISSYLWFFAKSVWISKEGNRDPRTARSVWFLKEWKRDPRTAKSVRI